MTYRADKSWSVRLDPTLAAMAPYASPPAFPTPMRPITGRRLFSDPNWLFEPLVSGQRAMAYRIGRAAYLYHGRRTALSQQYPAIIEAVRNQPHDEFLLDGVIVGGRGHSARQQGAAGPADQKPRFIAFDILYCDGCCLEALPLLTRRRILYDVVSTSPAFGFLPYVRQHGTRYFARARAFGHRGIVAKDIDSLYICGQSPLWRKFLIRDFTGGEAENLTL